MSLLSSSNEIMAEPLLACNHHNDGDQCNTRRRQPRWSNRSPSRPELSTSFIYLRPKFLLAGFWFGVVMELAYIQSIRLGMVILEQATNDGNYSLSVRVETWTDVLFYEMSFLYADVMVLLYLVILTRHTLKRKLSLSLPIMAANWIVGMVLGLSLALALVMGPMVVMQQHIWKALGCMVAGVALCFVAYYTALEMEKHFISEPPCSFAYSSCEDKSEQDTRSDVRDHRTISMIAAHLV